MRIEDERMRRMEPDRQHRGRELILLPNTIDGDLVRAIFGESESAATEANHGRLKKAASRTVWPG
jgi:hypothetical protein